MNGVRTWVEINQNHFNHNVSQYKRIIGHRNLSIVVKANAYGHGITQIARLAQSNSDVYSLCVASLKEALKIRNEGITKPVLVTSILDENPALIINKNIAVTIYDLEIAQRLESIGAQNNALLPVHIKIDTGLSRLGIPPENALEYSKIIKKMPHLSIQGIYSHCAESDKKDNVFTLEQRRIFKELVDTLHTNGLRFPLIHLANSAATTSLDLEFCNFFRVGIGIFGLWPSEENKVITQAAYPWFDLKPILTWKTKIQAIKTVNAGSYIGYSRTFQADKTMRIAMLPVGYYDGYDFRLFNKGSVLLHNQTAPIIGRISMNMSSIDITHIPETRIGDEVILIGSDPRVHPYELGVLVGNRNVREITTKINSAIPRVIVNENNLLPNSVQKKIRYTKSSS